MASSPLTLQNGACSATFDLDDGFRLCSLVLGGRELLAHDAGRGEFWWGSFVMAPWTSDLVDGRFSFLGEEFQVPTDLNDAAIHGIARKQTWTWDGRAASCQLGSDWPFGGRVSVTPALGSDTLTMTMILEAADRPMPGAIGWHPWFIREIDGAPGHVHLPANTLLQHRDQSGQPTGLWQRLKPGPLNDGVRVTDPVTVTWPGAGAVEVVSDGGYMIIFDDNDHGICVEPMTSPAGTMDRLLLPGEQISLNFTIRWLTA